MALPEEELRALVREAVARRLGPPPAPPPAVSTSFDRAHPSLVLLPVRRGSAGDGSCLIEPTVDCVHCGYCQSYGH